MGLRGRIAVCAWAIAACGSKGEEQVAISFEYSDRVSDFLDDAARMLERPIFRDPNNPRLEARMGSQVRHKGPRAKLHETIDRGTRPALPMRPGAVPARAPPASSTLERCARSHWRPSASRPP